jgi:hypothetical protein
MPFEITNTLRGSSIVRAVDPGTYTVTLNDLRANATIETVTAADIRHVKWSTNGNIRIVRNSIPLLALHSGGSMDFDEYGHSIANNNTQSIVIEIVTGGTVVLELAKYATYNVDPYTGVSI